MTTKELADLLRMSQTPIREALCILEHEHFVVRLPKRGYVVNVMDVNEFIDIYDMRIAIEVLAVELATQKIKAAGITRLEKILNDIACNVQRVFTSGVETMGGRHQRGWN